MRGRVDLSRIASRELDRLEVVTRRRVRFVITERLTALPLPANLDMRPIQGLPPWLRVRVGDYRIICRALTNSELRVGPAAPSGYLVGRIVHRRDLPRTLRQL